MRKVLMNLIFLCIVALLVVGFKSYTIYYYEPVKVDINIGSKVKIERNDKKTNYRLENLNYYLDDKYKTTDNGENYILSNEVVEDKENTNTTTITFEIKHNLIENISINNNKLEKVDHIPFMKYSKLNNEIDLVNYYIKEKNNKAKLTDLIYQLGTKYLSSVFIKGMGLDKNIKELDGLDGYLFKDGQDTKVILFNEGNSYEITFSEDFIEEDIVEILNGFEFN